MNKKWIALIFLSVFSGNVFAHDGHTSSSMVSEWLHTISSAHHGFAGLLVLAVVMFCMHLYKRFRQS